MDTVNPLIMMGALTGKPTREEIIKILTCYREVGIEQYLIYPRSGCELEYFSEEYLSTVETICEEAEKLGYKSIWLYDEFNWPSGSCAHTIPQENPAYAAQFICAYNVNGEIKVEIRRNHNYTDLMNPTAVDRFIELTHERYYKRLGKWFGTLIKGIFTDEPEVGFFRPAVEDVPLFFMGYYDGLADDYRAATGGDLFNDIASGVRAAKDFYPTECAPLLAKRFRECFIDRVQAWCSAHGVVLTGHLMDETSTRAARLANGEVLTALSGMKLPAMDDIWCNTDMNAFEFLTYGTVLYAIEQQGNNGGLAELFACHKCDINFAKLQQELFMAAAFGIDHYVLAVAAMDPRGNSIKKEHFNPFSWEVPHLPAFKEWSKSARRAAALATAKRVYDVAVRYTNNAPELNNLLRDLTSRQISWKLINNLDSIPDDVQMVLNCSHQRMPIREEKHNCMGWAFEQIHTRLKEKFHLPCQVCYPDGALVKDVFVRRYADGTLLVIDMAGRNRELVLHRNGQAIEFALPRFGVAEFPGWQLEFDNKHTIRVEFDSSNRAVIKLDQAADLHLALRDYAGSAEVELDGQVVNPTLPCCGLPASYNQLYKLADLGKVSAGEHTFVLKSNIEDFAFLPAAILLGGEELPAYAGRINQSAKVFIPDTAMKIKTAHTAPPGDVELFINDQSCGTRLTAPYEWIIPEDSRGRVVEIKFSYSSSIAALYGNPWRGTTELDSALRGLFAPDYHGKPNVLEIIFE